MNTEEPDSVNSSRSHESKGIVERGYDAIAPAYLAWSAPRPTTTRLAYIHKLFGLLPAGAEVLELGCGAGVPSTQMLANHGFRVTGVDISSAQIGLAREHVPQATLIHGDMMGVELAEGSFDAVVAFYSIFHLPKDEQGLMVRKIARWLRVGGWMLFNLGSKEGDVVWDDWMGAKMFSSGLGIEGNRAMLEKEGGRFRIVEDEIAVELVGGIEEKFHWVLAVKKDDTEASV